METYTFEQLDSIARYRVMRSYTVETGDIYERDWNAMFANVRFYADGSRAS